MISYSNMQFHGIFISFLSGLFCLETLIADHAHPEASFSQKTPPPCDLFLHFLFLSIAPEKKDVERSANPQSLFL